VAQLILKRVSASRPSGEWNDDDFDVLADGAVVGRIMKAAAAPVEATWLWTILCYEDRQSTRATSRRARPRWRRSPRAGGRSSSKLGREVRLRGANWKTCAHSEPYRF